ncbi:TonB-dependent receptor plug domain-containing protein [Dyella psychrodurans]|uniref:TonB-dependent receptor n=1 Tax=Dyella psychrodurans TaxID=1927960 RepID=A0A370XD59_9GAMM|nr:TonB-dependent receptor [Dyella psychrodurans]RDS86346.1 TonB-dependent receptor [Dyella psychrodurans]
MLKSKLAAAVVAALAFGCANAYAGNTSPSDPANAPQDAQSNSQSAPSTTADDASKKAKKLQEVIVTGSLIPQVDVETSKPLITITAQQLKDRGFTSVADALQAGTFATGSVQGSNNSAGFTQSAKTLSFFGLDPSYTKYLIDGLPMGDFPALYNGSEAFNNLASIPIEMIDHIDILPGGQSSIYGSDAIAGVINIVLKKTLDAPVVDARFGWHTGGGGADRRVYAADGFTWGNLNFVGGIQVESIEPIWGFDRSLTRQYFTQGTTPATASRDYLVLSETQLVNAYYSPNQLNPGIGCSAVTGQFGGTEQLQNRANHGQYCGSQDSAGYVTETNKQNTVNLYTHATYDLNSNVQLYQTLLYTYDQQKFSAGSNFLFWQSPIYYDANLGDFVLAQHAFSPEEAGGYQNILDNNVENSVYLSLGAKGGFGQSNWDYDLTFNHSEDHLQERTFQRWTTAINNYFGNILGPNLGPDPLGFGYPTYTPNYQAFYTPVPNSAFRAFTGYSETYAKTWDNMLRGQVTNSSLFSLPGGDAGLATVIEGGNQGWNYSPDPRTLDGETYEFTDVSGAGHRSRYAGTVEFNAPLFKMLTVDMSGRYDDYNVAGGTVSHATYNLGVEFRPFGDLLLLRGTYGTAFKAPTLPDEFQGPSGYYSSVVDYYNCAKLGYTGGNVANCPGQLSGEQFFGQQSGNPKLQPIVAKTFNLGFVLSPFEGFSLKSDYYHYNIRNEVEVQSSDFLAQTESNCRLGIFDINSPTCQDALAKVIRSGTPLAPGLLPPITEILTPKVNVAREYLNAVITEANYSHVIGPYGSIDVKTSWSDIMTHRQQLLPGDPFINLLREPYYSTEFKSRVDGSVGWLSPTQTWGVTLYGIRDGASPNYLATLDNNYYSPGAGKLAPWIRYNLTASYSPIKNLALTLDIVNVLNKMPPLDRSYPGTESQPFNQLNYDVNGREFFVEATYKFGNAK